MAEIDVTRIAGNIGAMNTLNSLQSINKQLAMHQTRLASGKQINSAADDPAGLTIATKMHTNSEGLRVALGNIGDAKNLLSVAESGLSKINDILLQMRNKAEQASSDTMGDDERDAINTQLTEFAAQIDDLTDQTKWNGTALLDGTSNSLRFQTGAESGDATTFTGLAGGLDTATLFTTNGIPTTDNTDPANPVVPPASDYVTFMDDVTAAMTTVNKQLTSVGAMTARLTFKEDQVTSARPTSKPRTTAL